MTAGMPAVAARGLIVSGAHSNGFDLSNAAVEAASLALSTSTRLDPETSHYVPVDGEFRATRWDGTSLVDIGLVEHVMGLVRQHATPSIARPSDPPVTLSRYAGQTAAAATIVERMRRQDAADALAHAQALASGPNPWATATLNRTKQAMIRKFLPQVAAQLQARASR